MPRLAPLLATGLLVVAALGSCSESDDDPLGDRSTATTDAEGPAVRYVALGDSYSAGGGAPPYLQDGANCYRSELSWPFLIDEGPVDLRACGGATIPDLLTGRADGSREPQLPADPRPDVELVTLTLGGNDVGSVLFVGACVTGECVQSYDPQVARVLQAAFRDNLLDDLYPALHRAFPNARIVHVGYPQLVPARAAEVVGCPWLTEPERALIREIGDDIDAITSEAAEEAEADGLPVEYLSTSDALEGHELCTAAPQFVAMGMPDGSGGHLDPRGYETYAAAIAEQL